MNERRFKVASVDEVREDGTLQVKCGAVPVCLYNVGGRIYATHDVCTHGHASLADGFIEGENIVCPLHQGLFHIPTGKAVGAPCMKDISVFSVEVDNGAVYVAIAELGVKAAK